MEQDSRYPRTASERFNSLIEDLQAESPQPIRVLTTVHGKTFIHPRFGATYKPFMAGEPSVCVTNVQIDYLSLMARGMTNEEIAAARSTPENEISLFTVRNEISKIIFPNLGATNRTHAVVKALQMRFLDLNTIPDMSGTRIEPVGKRQQK